MRPLCYIDHARIDILFHVLGLSASDVARALEIPRETVMRRVTDTHGTDLIATIERHGVALGCIAHCRPELVAA